MGALNRGNPSAQAGPASAPSMQAPMMGGFGSSVGGGGSPMGMDMNSWAPMLQQMLLSAQRRGQGTGTGAPSPFYPS